VFFAQTNSFLAISSQLSCQLPTLELSIHFSAETVISSHLSSQSSTLNSQFSTDFARTEKKTPFPTIPHIVVFTDPLLRNGFYCFVQVHFRGNLFTEPLPSNELFQLSGVTSQYVI
jgi:hypothetical protein